MKQYLFLNKQQYQNNFLALEKYFNKKPAAALKNNAYGLGLLEIAQMVEEVGCETYFIYNLQEGISLRKILNPNKKATIISLGNIEGEYLDRYLQYNITPTIGSLEEIHLYKHQLLSKMQFAIYFDTGLHGKGILWEDAEQTYYLVKNLPIKIIISHLSSAWKTDQLNNILQQTRFKQIQNIFRDNKDILYSLTNTDGSRLGPEYFCDLPRIGRGLHGLSYYGDIFCVKQAFKLIGQVTQVKFIKLGDHVGYGGESKIQQDSNIASINIGAYHINQINFPFSRQVIWNNKTYDVLTIFLGYMMVDFREDCPKYLDEVELIFYSKFNPNTF